MGIINDSVRAAEAMAKAMTEELRAENERLRNRLNWLQAQAEEGCVTMCFEMDGGVHVTLDPVGGEQRAARNVATISEGIDRLMQPNDQHNRPASAGPG